MLVLAPRVFGDELVSATDLNRRPGHVLDLARRRPVTVTRGDEAFALLRREDAAHMADGLVHVEALVDLMVAVHRLGSLTQPLERDHRFYWLTVFDTDEIDELFVEAGSAFKDALYGEGSWEEFEAVLHEWHESAMAVGSQELTAAFEAEADEVSLTKPEVKDAAELYSEVNCD